MKAPKKTTTIFQRVEDPSRAFFGQARGRVAEVMATEPIPGRITAPSGGFAQRVRKASGRIVLYEKRGSLEVITARVQNVAEVYDEIDALLYPIEGRKAARYTRQRMRGAKSSPACVTTMPPMLWPSSTAGSGCEARASPAQAGATAALDTTEMNAYPIEPPVEPMLARIAEALPAEGAFL